MGSPAKPEDKKKSYKIIKVSVPKFLIGLSKGGGGVENVLLSGGTNLAFACSLTCSQILQRIVLER